MSAFSLNVLDPISQSEWTTLSELLRELRKLKRDDLFVPVARLQLHYLLKPHPASIDRDLDSEATKKFRSVLFNIASFTWPGWGDLPPITEDHQELGRSAARTALKLEEQVNEVSLEVLWMNGAHDLNARQYSAARDYFTRAEAVATKRVDRLMPRGWIALCDLLVNSSPKNLAQLESSLNDLRTHDTENGEFFAEQIETAQLIYHVHSSK